MSAPRDGPKGSTVAGSTPGEGGTAPPIPFIEAGLADHLASGRTAADVAQFLAAILAVTILWEAMSPAVGLGWLSLVALAIGVRVGLRQRHAGAEVDALHRLRVLRRDALGGAGMWAILPWFFIGRPVQDLLFLLIILAGVVAAAMGTLVSDLRSFRGLVALVLGPVTLVVALSGMSRDHWAMLALLAVFAPLMILVHSRAHRVLARQIADAERLRASRDVEGEKLRFLEALLSAAPVPIMVLTEDFHVVRANPAFEHVLGYPVAQVRGRRIPDVPEDPTSRANLDDFLRSIPAKAPAASELELKRADGRSIWLRLSGTRTSGDDYPVIVCIGEDVTEQVVLREAQNAARIAAQEAERAKTAFLANVSHEIRTPLHGILGLVELLLDTELESDQREWAELIRHSGLSLLGILSNVLDLSKIEARQLQLERMDFDLVALVHDTARGSILEAVKEGHELVVDVHPDLPKFVTGDPARIRQVLANVVGNAIKYTNEGEVVLSVQPITHDDGSRRIRFSVRDTGAGIARAQLASIFVEFERTKRPGPGAPGGTGLGLPISRRLVELMGGKLEVETEEGVGSEFSFAIPLPKAAQADPADQISLHEQLLGSRFLTVDDSETVRRITATMLRSVGAARVDEAASVDDALERMRDAAERGEAYSAIILDHLMPEKSGFDFARELRSAEAGDEAPMLMLTSTAIAGGRELARELGFAGYLTKPVSRDELVRALETILEQSRYAGTERRMVTRGSMSLPGPELNRRILVAEDNRVNQKVARALLEKIGYDVHVVENGSLAVRAIEKERFDLVLMDIRMPVMDGIEAARRITALPSAAGVPIVAASAHAFKEQEERCREVGMVDFLAKPFIPEELYATVDRWIGSNEYEPAIGAGRDRRSTDRPTSEASERGLDREADAAATEPPEAEVSSAEVVAGVSVGPTENVADLPVDLEGFRASMRDAGIEDVVDEMLDTYCEETPRIFEKLRGAVAAGDSDGIHAAAHALKSSSGNIWANGLMRLFERLERLGRAGDTAGAETVFAEAEPEFVAVMSCLSDRAKL